MDLTVDDYQLQLQALLPPGALWSSLINDPVFSGLLAAWADEFARIDGRAGDLITESDPRTTNELLTDWERVLGLPDTCVTTAQTIQQRIDAVLGRLTATGGQSLPYLIGLAASMGFAITIEDTITPHRWRVIVTNIDAQRLSVGTGPGHQVGEALRTFGAEQLLECVFLRIAHAHTRVQFTYGPNGSYTTILQPVL